MSQQRPERPRNFVPPQVPPGPSRRTIDYLIGLGIGAIPLAFFFLAIGTLASAFAVNLLVLALILYFGLFLATIVCLTIPRSRFFGYGMLTMFLITPVVAYIACVATFRYCYHTCA